MIPSTIAITYQEAVQVLKKNYEQLMQNKNWKFIAILEDRKLGFHYAVGVHDFDKEVENIENDSYQYKIENYKKTEDVIDFSIASKLLNGRFHHDFNVKIHKDYIAQFYQGEAKKLRELCANTTTTCDTREKRKMGHLLANIKRSSEGSIGCFLSDKAGNKYALTAYHVVRGNKRNDDTDIGDVIESPPTKKESLGKLAWYKYDNTADIALISLDADVEIEKGSVCCYQLKEHFGPEPMVGNSVKICSSVDDIKMKCGIILSTCCVVQKHDDHENCMFGMIQTTDLGERGDSGSIVSNMKNEALGLLVRDKWEECSYFMPLDILKSKIELKLENKLFEFEKFH